MWLRALVWGGWFACGMFYGVIASFRYTVQHRGGSMPMQDMLHWMPQSHYDCMAIAAVTYIVWAVLEAVGLLASRKEAFLK